ncbi:MAG: Rpn family recombination-promoting nuclease/putative transposase [Clostridium sp.]|jgi:predicted transposase/invertase (TIGR01784 family)|nr:Rpn family recombination-promoting nuclease/putative transposase [Lachnospiraceae bacterium]
MAMKMKKYEELELRDDFMFSRIMSNPKFVKPLLETILGVKIRKIVYPQTQKTIDLSLQAKGIRLDVYVEDDQNTVFNLEMQTSDGANLPKRMRYYQGMIDLNILDKGQDYTTLKKSYVIFICTFDPFGEGRHIYTFCNTCQENTALTLDDDAVKIILSTKGTMDDVSPEMKRILDYIDGKGASDKFTEELEEAVRSARQNERWRLDYMTLEYEYRQRYLEGKEEGREEGRAEGRERTIQKLHERGESIASIADIVELNEEEVKRVISELA